MHIKATLLAIATASAVTAQPDFEDAFVNSAKYWSDYGDYLAKVLGDSVNVATAGKDKDYTTYHLNCASQATTSTDYYGCIVGDGATVIMGQNIIDMQTIANGQTISQHCSYNGPDTPTCTMVRIADGTSSTMTATVAASELGVAPGGGAATQTSDTTASTKASPSANTASATATASAESASTDQSATESATETPRNAGMRHATGNAWAVGGAVMAIALAVI